MLQPFKEIYESKSYIFLSHIIIQPWIGYFEHWAKFDYCSSL